MAASELPHQNLLIAHGVRDPRPAHVVTELMACDLEAVIHRDARDPEPPGRPPHRARRRRGLAHLHAHGIVHRDLKLRTPAQTSTAALQDRGL